MGCIPPPPLYYRFLDARLVNSAHPPALPQTSPRCCCSPSSSNTDAGSPGGTSLCSPEMSPSSPWGAPCLASAAAGNREWMVWVASNGVWAFVWGPESERRHPLRVNNGLETNHPADHCPITADRVPYSQLPPHVLRVDDVDGSSSLELGRSLAQRQVWGWTRTRSKSPLGR